MRGGIFWLFDIECGECAIIQVKVDIEPAADDGAQQGDEEELSCAQPACLAVLDEDPEHQQEDGGEDEESPLPAQYQHSQRYAGGEDQFVIMCGGFEDFVDQINGEQDEEDHVGLAAYLRKGFVINGEKRQHREG